MERTKTGVIGIGQAGMQHARMYQELPDSILLGVFDIDKEKALRAAKDLGVIVFDDLETLIGEVDALSIATPLSTHYSIAKKLLQTGKHVLIESSFCQTESEAQELIDLAKEKNCRLSIGHVDRFNAALEALEDIPLKPDFLEALRLSSYKTDGREIQVVGDLMLQDIYLVLHIVKSKLRSVEASGAKVISSGIDIANARLEFENGCVANLTASRISTKPVTKMRLYQPDAQITIDYIDGHSEIFYLAGQGQSPFHDGTLALSLGTVNNREIKYNRLKREQVNPLRNEIRNFIVGIRNNLPMLISGEDSLEALKLANQIEAKIQQQQEQRQRES